MGERQAPVQLEYARPESTQWASLVLLVMAIAGVHAGLSTVCSGLQEYLAGPTTSTYSVFGWVVHVVENVLTPVTQLLLRSNIGFASLTEIVFLAAFAMDGLLYGVSATLLYVWIKRRRLPEASQARRARQWTRIIVLALAVLWVHHLLFWTSHQEALASMRTLHWAVSPLCELVAHTCSSTIPVQFPALLDSLVYGFVIALCIVWFRRSRGGNVHG